MDWAAIVEEAEAAARKDKLARHSAGPAPPPSDPNTGNYTAPDIGVENKKASPAGPRPRSWAKPVPTPETAKPTPAQVAAKKAGPPPAPTTTRQQQSPGPGRQQRLDHGPAPQGLAQAVTAPSE